jgi:probable phosphoglycerate mutase
MLEIYITRHGETEWNRIRRFQGQGDSPLTELGMQQASWLGMRLKDIGIKKIYSSPLGRAKKTAEIINQFVHVDIELDERLKEIHVGDWEGQLITDIEKSMPQEHYDFWHNPVEFKIDNQESFQSVQDRAADFFENILATHSTGKLLIVAHAIILKGLLNYIQGRHLTLFWEGSHILPTSLSRVNSEDDRLSVAYLSDISHYELPLEKGWFIDED